MVGEIFGLVASGTVVISVLTVVAAVIVGSRSESEVRSETMLVESRIPTTPRD